MQEIRQLLGDTHTAAVWLRENYSSLNSIEGVSNLSRSAESTKDLMESCKDILAILTDDLSSIAQQNVRLHRCLGNTSPPQGDGWHTHCLVLCRV